MNTIYLLILLTTNSDGMLSVSFVNTDSMENCLVRSTMIKAIFKSSNIAIDQSRCVESNLRFSKYEHQISSNVRRYYWFIDLTRGKERLMQVENINACKQVIESKPKETVESFYCAATNQRLLRDS